LRTLALQVALFRKNTLSGKNMCNAYAKARRASAIGWPGLASAPCFHAARSILFRSRAAKPIRCRSKNRWIDPRRSQNTGCRPKSIQIGR
jgi:hypothetical protein